MGNKIMQTTLGKEDQNRILFLNILIIKSEGSFQTTCYSRPTYTEVGLHYFTVTENLCKINVIYICYWKGHSKLDALRGELITPMDYFKRNRYSIRLTEKMIKKFRDRLYEKKTRAGRVNKTVKYIKFPYYGTSSFKVRMNLKNC